MNVERGEPFEACFESAITGLTNVVSLTLIDNDGGIFWPSSTADIIETPAGSGVYCANRTAPIVVGHYSMIWSLDGTYDPLTVSIDDLFVLSVGATFPPLVPSDQDGGPVPGPCFGWVSAEQVAECCSLDLEEDFALFEGSATSSSQLLYALSGRQFPGQCERVVRPFSDIPCGVQVLARGYVVGWEGARTDADFGRIMLPNYPVTEIIEVKIDGDTLAESEYRLDGWRWLTRLADVDGDRQFWPGPQRDDRADTEDDTFSIRYYFGQNPPQAGIDAAAQLACEVYKACPNREGVSADCAIPKNAVRVSRQGITIEMKALRYSAKEGWQTGLKLVDAFLNAFNPDGVKQRSLIWSPDPPRFAREVGTVLGS